MFTAWTRASTMTATLVVEFGLQPPANVAHPAGLSPTKLHEFPLSANSNIGSSAASYYSALSTAIRQAKTDTGDELTRWRDAVGAVESSKEPRAKADEDDEDEDEDAEGS